LRHSPSLADPSSTRTASCSPPSGGREDVFPGEAGWSSPLGARAGGSHISLSAIEKRSEEFVVTIAEPAVCSAVVIVVFAVN
jgi:hypothetical protein